VGGHGRHAPPDIVGRVLRPQGQGVLIGQAVGDVAVELVMGRRLIGEDVGGEASADQLRQDVGRVAEQGDRKRNALLGRVLGQPEGLVQAVGHRIHVAGVEPPLDPAPVDFNDDGHAVVHGDRQGLGAAHSPKAGRDGDRPLQGSAEVLFRRGGQGFVRPLEDALGADINPASSCHLSIHNQAEFV